MSEKIIEISNLDTIVELFGPYDAIAQRIERNSALPFTAATEKFVFPVRKTAWKWRERSFCIWKSC